MYLKSLLLILFWLFNLGKGVFSPDIIVCESGYMFGDGKTLSIMDYWERFQLCVFHQLILGPIIPAGLWLLDEVDGAWVIVAVR